MAVVVLTKASQSILTYFNNLTSLMKLIGSCQGQKEILSGGMKTKEKDFHHDLA